MDFKANIFEQLGNAFYAIASEQGVSGLVMGELKMLLKKDWLFDDEMPDDKVPEPAHRMGLAIDALQTDQIPPSRAFSEFERFYFEHEEQFSFAFKQKILETAASILRVFPGEQGKRNVYYENLQRLLRRTMQGMKSTS